MSPLLWLSGNEKYQSRCSNERHAKTRQMNSLFTLGQQGFGAEFQMVLQQITEGTSADMLMPTMFDSDYITH